MSAVELEVERELQQSCRARITRVVPMAESGGSVLAGRRPLIEQTPGGIVVRDSVTHQCQSFVEKAQTTLDASPAAQRGA